MRLVEPLYFTCCLVVGRILRSGRYSDVRLTWGSGAEEVRKRRRFYAPLLVRASGPIFALLGTGMRVLTARAWAERERRLYQLLGRGSVRAENGGLVLPKLPGATLASLLDDAVLNETDRRRAIELSLRALAELHGVGVTHGDAMAENVLVDLAGGAAHWFDFETVHEPDRCLPWRRADDLRALLATSLVRTRQDAIPSTISWFIGGYPDREAWELLAQRFAPILQRPLAFHLGQAPLSLAKYRAIARLLTDHFPPAPIT
jgi:serine/threonine protein kinase